MNQMNRKALVREYMETPRPAGVYRVHNTATGRSLIGSTANLPARLNRHRFQLEHGSHPVRALQKDWRELGADVFAFEVLDRLEKPEDAAYDPTDDLDTLEEMWVDKLTAAGASLYFWSGHDA